MVNLRTICPLPKPYYWQVEVITGLDSVHLYLHKRWAGYETSECVVISAFSKPVDVWVEQLIDRSYIIWEGYMAKNKIDRKAWEGKAADLRQRLGTLVKIKIR